jgi:hypothetical protein
VWLVRPEEEEGRGAFTLGCVRAGEVMLGTGANDSQASWAKKGEGPSRKGRGGRPVVGDGLVGKGWWDVAEG